MDTKQYLKWRTQLKHDTSENWSKAVNFIPLDGEMIIYTDLKRFKIGDGQTLVNDLPFFDQEPKTLVQIMTWEEND